MKRVVLVGGGPAAVSAAATLRAGGYDGGIVLVTDDPELPYERPPLSKEFLTPGETAGGLSYLKPEAWYAEQDVAVLTGTRATALDPTARQVRCSDGSVLDYDAVLLATGVRPRAGVPADDDGRVIVLRTAAHGTALRDRLAAAERVVVLGGGFIGCEVAATAVGMGKQVTLIERTGGLLHRALGADVGRVLTDVHRANGVDLRLGTVVLEQIRSGRQIALRTDKGTVTADVVVVGAGSEPNVELAESAGIDVAAGIVTDAYCRTSAPGVYAAGDVAAVFHQFYGDHVRVEHHDTAGRQGAAAARAMLGAATPAVEPHWFWSDQYQHNIQCVGRAAPTDELVLRGSLDDLSFAALWLRGDRITRAIGVNRARDVMAVRKILFTDHSVRAADLADSDSDLRRLTRSRRIA